MDTKSQIESLLIAKNDEILKYINSIIGDKLRTQVNAEEILAETVRYAMENPGCLENRTQEKAMYFFLWKAKKLVLNQARSFKTRTTHQQAKSEENQNEVALDVEPSPTFLLHRADKRLALRECLNLLSNEAQRNALKLVKIDGLSAEDAAKAMGKTPEAVRNLVKRGFASLVQKVYAAGGRKYATTGETT